MQMYRLVSAGLSVSLALACVVILEARRGTQQQPATPPPTVPAVPAPRMPLAPAAVRGASVTPALEGWFKNPDGTATILVGYMNRNQSQVFDVPVGPNNSIETGGPDFGQPTHFELGRNYGVFSVTVPKDFGTKRLTYTISVNNQPQTITLGLPNGYQIEPFFRNDTGNSPPVVKLDPKGPELKGPPRGVAQTLSATVGQPLTLTLYATDKGNTISQQDQFGTAPADSRPRILRRLPPIRRPRAGLLVVGRQLDEAVPHAELVERRPELPPLLIRIPPPMTAQQCRMCRAQQLHVAHVVPARIQSA